MSGRRPSPRGGLIYQIIRYSDKLQAMHSLCDSLEIWQWPNTPSYAIIGALRGIRRMLYPTPTYLIM
jgi:hypothetical protein